jgi:hypothetical protein
MNLRNRVIWPLLALVALALVPAQSSATNGMYLTG